MEEGIVLSPESLSEDQLCEHAKEILQPEKRKRLSVLVDRAKKALADNRASDHIDEVAAAAISGRVDVLYIDYDKHYFATIDWQTMKIIKKDAQHAMDLYDEIAKVVLNNRGKVLIIDSAMMPTTTGICALYK
jgi:hypothetical protein